MEKAAIAVLRGLEWASPRMEAFLMAHKWVAVPALALFVWLSGEPA